ncbi:hypothetical protein AAZX31_08G202900 [Glycine max]|uniref:Uncharacterized protein n=1 Tax=Glycine soja TaxID=3848 RepID=A0A0B2SSF3_GLYSO|nr:hypothetical protein glysoja_029236 [Glycine soja]
MLLRETFRKTKVFFNKSFQKFWSFFFGEYQKLPRSLSFNPFLSRVGNARTHTSDQRYNDMLQSDLGRTKMYGNNMSMTAMEDAQKSMHEERAQEKKNKG